MAQPASLDEGLRALEEALAAVQRNEEHHYEAEVYRLKGELLLQQSAAHRRRRRRSFSGPAGVARSRQAKSVGAAGGDEPEPPVAAPGQARWSPRSASWHRSTTGSPRALTPL